MYVWRIKPITVSILEMSYSIHFTKHSIISKANFILLVRKTSRQLVTSGPNFRQERERERDKDRNRKIQADKKVPSVHVLYSILRYVIPCQF